MIKEYELTKQQLDTLLDAIKPMPIMTIGSHVTGLDRQERANDAWKLLGDELGFDHMTARPVSGKGMEYFTAESKD